MTSAPLIEGWRHIYSGKVRDLYVPLPGGEYDPERHVLVVASDRISAYDWVLPTTIPDKGKILTTMTLWWFEQLADIVPNHVVSTDVPEVVAGRAMICEHLMMQPVECVVRGYLTGSGLVDYRASGNVCGVELPAGLTEASRLPEPIFTPAAKAQVGEHDENVSFEQVAGTVGVGVAHDLRNLSQRIYGRASELAAQRGIILADTKFEFGQSTLDGPLILADEVLTPDSSRFWDAEEWCEGRVTPSFDKQYVRDWLVSSDANWDRSGKQNPPPLPASVVAATRERYLDALVRLTGRGLES
ncbi:phosphoribosylaminoimidazolesuccinocarboxamide synthase [Actinomycetaceae bacterium TAE3-ERU4]|nr:phosphoribosylaminoimidazolesuccinocarboxamide synthase [Actinomycetaceae bacterium TAE3-ERU4]